MMVTDLGFDVVEILHKYCPSVVSLKLTRKLEEKMEQIQNDMEKRENVILEAVGQLQPILEKFMKKEKVIGQVLSDAITRAQKQERMIGTCPNCGTGKLMILHSRQTRKRFIGCTSYFHGLCKTSFPLPQRGTVKPALKNCPACGWPLVHVWIKARQPWILCFNPNCPTRMKRT